MGAFVFDLVMQFVGWAVWAAVALGVLTVAFAAIRYGTAFGDSQKISSATTTLKLGLATVVIALMAVPFTGWFTGYISDRISDSDELGDIADQQTLPGSDDFTTN